MVAALFLPSTYHACVTFRPTLTQNPTGKGILENIAYSLLKLAYQNPAQMEKLWNRHAMEYCIAFIMNKVQLQTQHGRIL